MLRSLHFMWLLLTLETVTDTDVVDEEDDTDEDEGPDAEDADDEEEPRDPKAKWSAMQSHLNRLHKKVAKQAKRIQELEEGEEGQEPSDLADSLLFSRLETAFLRAILARGETLDIETAWDLANIRGFLDVLEVDEDGNVEGMDDMLEKVLDRYPWLADEPAYEPEDEPEGDPSNPVRRSRRPPRRKDASASKQVEAASLRKRFPALAKPKGR